MAYQSGGGMGPGQQSMQDHGPPATEYTLQGVMRFLQIEWHNHERARNAWEIERAEMKAKIAKQEGELRHSKRINESLERHAKILEIALRKERAKTQSTSDEQPSASPAKNDNPASAITNVSKNKPESADHVGETDATSEAHEQSREKSRKYLEKCMQEIQYLLAPPPHPPAIQNYLPNGQLPGIPEPPPPQPEDVLPQQRPRPQLSINSSYDRTEPRRQAPPVIARRGDHQVPDPSLDDPTYGAPEVGFSSKALPLVDSKPQQTNLQQQGHMQAEVSSFTIEQPLPDRTVPQVTVDESDGWNFGESQVMPQSTLDNHLGRRPDTDAFPSALELTAKSPPRAGPGSHRRRSSGASSTGRRKSAGSQETYDSGVEFNGHNDPSIFKVRFALRGHMDVVRSVIFTGGGSPSEPEVCTAGDDGMIKRWIIPASYGNVQHSHAINDLDISSYFTHRGHEGIITSLAACPSTSFSTGGRASGDGWIFSGGQDATVRVWERGRVDPKAVLDGHTDAVWTVCVLPGTCGSVFGNQSSNYGGADRILLASGSADGSVKVWAVSAPPHLAAPQASNRRGVGGGRRHSVTSGSNHPSSPQPNTATSTPFHYTLVHDIKRGSDITASPTCICALGPNGDNFVVSYSDSSVLIFDTRTGEEVLGMASNETYDGTPATSINTIAATSTAVSGLDVGGSASGVGGGSSWVEDREDAGPAGPTGSAQGVEGVIVSGHEDRYIRFFDANSGQCTYSMLAHTSSISSLSLSQDGHEAVSAGHDASIRFWSLDKRICTQDITSHRPMRGEGVCSVVWSQDRRYVVSAGGDGVVKVFSR